MSKPYSVTITASSETINESGELTDLQVSSKTILLSGEKEELEEFSRIIASRVASNLRNSILAQEATRLMAGSIPMAAGITGFSLPALVLGLMGLAAGKANRSSGTKMTNMAATINHGALDAAITAIENDVKSAIVDKSSVIDFLKWKRDRLENRDKQFSDVSRLLTRRLNELGYEPSMSNAAGAVLDDILLESFPEYAALSAIRELRSQVRKASRGTKPTFQGKRSGTNPLKFLIENYADEISSGNFGPGQLQVLDKKLYQSVFETLRRASAVSDGQLSDDIRSDLGLDGKAAIPASVKELFELLSPVAAQGSPYQRRLRACAELLGTDETTAAKFFGSLRADRVPGAFTALTGAKKSIVSR